MRGSPFALVVAAAMATGCLPASLGARIVLLPERHSALPPSLPYQHVQLKKTVALDGWLFRPPGPVRGLVIYLHGRGGNRSMGERVARQLVPLGFAVLTYDQRGHGVSGGEYFTFGFYEKQDVVDWMDALQLGPVYLIGHSAGAGVALQTAAIDSRVRGVIAVAPFANLEDLIRVHSPAIVSQDNFHNVMGAVENRAHFDAEEVSPEMAARHIHVPVLLFHGTRDVVVPPGDSLRIWRALPVDGVSLQWVWGAGHSDVLGRSEVWAQMEAWLTGDGRANAP